MNAKSPHYKLNSILNYDETIVNQLTKTQLNRVKLGEESLIKCDKVVRLFLLNSITISGYTLASSFMEKKTTRLTVSS